jgi:hypothetical protein
MLYAKSVYIQFQKHPPHNLITETVKATVNRSKLESLKINVFLFIMVAGSFS